MEKRRDFFIKYKYLLLIIYLALVCTAVAVNLKLIYVLFVFAAGAILLEEFSVQSLWRVVVWSVMLPDNYTPIVIMGLVGVYTLWDKRKQISVDKKLMVPFAALMVVALISTVINRVPLLNVAVSLVYFSSILMMLLLFGLLGTGLTKGGFLSEKILIDVRLFMLTQIMGSFTRVFKDGIGFNIFKYDDWSNGTYGLSQIAIVFMTLMACTTIEIMLIVRDRSKNVLRYLLVLAALVVCLSTQCWAMSALAGVGFFVGLMCKKDKWSIAFLGMAVAGMIAGAVLIPIAVPEKVDFINRMRTDEDVLHRSANKFFVYKDTFLNIPSEDAKYALIGDGVGNYVSRGALTCSGLYVDAYNRFFEPNMSEHFLKYIQPSLELAYTRGEYEWGSIIARPYSTILALMGEVGYLGLILFLVIFGVLFARGDRFTKAILLAWLGTCFLENYIEYSKVVIMMMMALSVGYWISGEVDDKA